MRAIHVAFFFSFSVAPFNSGLGGDYAADLLLATWDRRCRDYAEHSCMYIYDEIRVPAGIISVDRQLITIPAERIYIPMSI